MCFREFLCVLFVAALSPNSCLASYYESWDVSAKILEIYDEVKTVSLLEAGVGYEVQKNNARRGMHIEVVDCASIQGHGKVKCQLAQKRVIVLSYDKALDTVNFVKGAILKLKYYYSDSAAPNGAYYSHLWVFEGVTAAEVNAKDPLGRRERP